MKLAGRTILITGGTSGIGLELATRLLQRGNTVLITGRDGAKLDRTKRALPGVNVFQSDVSDPLAISTLFAKVVTAFPALDLLINNAGIMRNLRLDTERSLVDVTQEVDILLSGPIRIVQQFLPHLRRAKEAGVVNVSSGLAFVPFAISPVYSAAKAGLHSYTQSLRYQLRATRIAVIELAPPPVETPLFRREFGEEMKNQKGMDVREFVSRAIAGIEAGKTEIRPGISNVLKIMSRAAPGFMFNQLAKTSAQKPGKSGEPAV